MKEDDYYWDRGYCDKCGKYFQVPDEHKFKNQSLNNVKDREDRQQDTRETYREQKSREHQEYVDEVARKNKEFRKKMGW